MNKQQVLESLPRIKQQDSVNKLKKVKLGHLKTELTEFSNQQMKDL